MNTRPDVVRELQSLFKEGATPSRLIRQIVDRHAGDRSFHALIQAYFAEAFGIPIVRGLDPVDDYRHADLRYAFLNSELVPEMIQKRREWDPACQPDGSDWLDRLQATDDQQRIGRVQGAAIPELSRCWPQLNEQEQQFIQRSFATANGLYESVKILSQLAECLQQQLAELHAATAETGDR